MHKLLTYQKTYKRAKPTYVRCQIKQILQQEKEKQYPLPKYLSKDLFSQWYWVYYLQVPVPTSEYMKNIVCFSNCVAKAFTRRTFYFLWAHELVLVSTLLWEKPLCRAFSLDTSMKWKDLSFPNRFNVNPGSKTTFNRRSGSRHWKSCDSTSSLSSTRSPCNAMHVRKTMPWSKEKCPWRVLSSFDPRTYKRKFIHPVWYSWNLSLEF